MFDNIYNKKNLGNNQNSFFTIVITQLTLNK